MLWILFALLSIGCVYDFSFSTSWLYPYYFGGASAQFLTMGKAWYLGKLPYVDMFDHKGPFIFIVVLDALQLRGMLIWMSFNPASRMSSRYLVINDDLLRDEFTLQSVWIHYKENRYHLSGIAVSESQNRGIAENGTAVLRHQNGGSESPGILILIIKRNEYTYLIHSYPLL